MTAEGLPIGRAKGNELHEAWVAWLMRIPWESFLTLTFAPLPYEWKTATGLPSRSRVERAASRLAKSLTDRLVKASYFGVVEEGSWSGRRHLHALTNLSVESDTIRAALAGHQQREGFTAARAISSIGGVSGYVTKYVTKTSDPIWIAGGPAWHRIRTS